KTRPGDGLAVRNQPGASSLLGLALRACFRSRAGCRSVPERELRVVWFQFTFLQQGVWLVRVVRWIPAALVAFVLWGGPASGETGKKEAKEESSFGSLKAPDAAEAKKQAEKWLSSVKKDADTLKKFNALWATDKPLLDKVAGTLVLGDAKAARLLADARNKKT